MTSGMTEVVWSPYHSLSRFISLPAGQRVQVFEKGEGAPLVYLHGSGLQLGWNNALEALSQNRRVVAPLFPGFGDSTGIENVDDMLDVVVVLNDILDTLGLEAADVVGFDLGGMFAAELAAVTPNRVKRLVLVAPFGLWIEGHDTADIYSLRRSRQLQALFSDTESEVAQKYLALPEDPALAEELTIQRTRAEASSTKFLWPIPDRGLSKRIYRIRAETLIVWGEQDNTIPPLYADAFQSRISGARVAWIKGGSHMLPLEYPEQLASAIESFLS